MDRHGEPEGRAHRGADRFRRANPRQIHLDDRAIHEPGAARRRDPDLARRGPFRPFSTIARQVLGARAAAIRDAALPARAFEDDRRGRRVSLSRQRQLHRRGARRQGRRQTQLRDGVRHRRRRAPRHDSIAVRPHLVRTRVRQLSPPRAVSGSARRRESKEGRKRE